jgi:hypothetical protein
MDLWASVFVGQYALHTFAIATFSFFSSRLRLCFTLFDLSSALFYGA